MYELDASMTRSTTVPLSTTRPLPVVLWATAGALMLAFQL
jgi:hypothetical protein